MVQPSPAPSLRELSSECETEGVSPVGCSEPPVYTPVHINSEFFTGYEHRSTLPQLRCAQQLPQRGSREWLVPFIRVLANIQSYGRFSSPLRNSEDLTLYHSSDDTPSVTPFGRASSLREGAGNGLVSFIGVLAKIQRCGRFSSPLRNSKDFTFHHSSEGTFSAVVGLLGKLAANHVHCVVHGLVFQVHQGVFVPEPPGGGGEFFVSVP